MDFVATVGIDIQHHLSEIEECTEVKKLQQKMSEVSSERANKEPGVQDEYVERGLRSLV